MNNKKPMGFNGISSLVSKLDLTGPEIAQEPIDETALHNNISKEEAKPKSSTRTEKTIEEESNSKSGFSPWVWVALLIIIIVAIVSSQENHNNSSYSESKNKNITPERITVPRTDKNTINNNNKLTFSMPEPGSNRVLSVSELRWCLREEITLNTYQTELNVNRSNDRVIDKYNELVEKYNARCGSYKYYEDQLNRAKREVFSLKNEIEYNALKNFKLLDTRTNSVNSNKYDVLDVQNALKIRGYDVGTVDGLMGNRTRDAIMQFQRDQLLEVDGKISPKLLNRLQIR
ncbi:peptidoglycan-binding protein [Vibrio parahaemolyticus]|uniref:peptidoglycan-binding domain-containing protein n=1 Tax=Vibrio TaxID=662 RepID=UPI001A8FD9FE|nr:peptidoglycan-binding domain-containing protein [Vibrio parahaemolyticus]EKO3577767.1 peptidoglycan-binding protein [Vibrio metschnikovii]EKO3774234.1 peptidoglycan-binding protein [Vibrio metschnikovii]MBO0153817.1 peptidoglycan-binding protein [Vibrio parahaemolyticus]MBO0173730.1 peptidoglycan-binding protein [Vibrio parahaemolyticus]MBO0181906.1 peptidoglycan-binding protein [Vibrio parahaemolyticus]